jgi:hypothetical protein
MKIQPYFVKLADTYILGPCISFEMGEVRFGLSLIFFEVGIALDTGKVWSFGCSGCSVIGYAKTDELPPGWEKRYRPDHTYYFLCAKCRGTVEPDDDYLVTDENRDVAIDEIISQLVGSGISEYVQALRDYANRMLDESEPFLKSDLAGSVAAYYDGFTDALRGQ